MMTILTVAAAASTNQLKNQEIMGEVQKEIANRGKLRSNKKIN